MATLAQFRTQFPEFQWCEDPFVQAHLDAALLETPTLIWGAKQDQGQMYLAAHKMALSPTGNTAKLIAKDGTTTYGKHRDRLAIQVSSGYRVA